MALTVVAFGLVAVTAVAIAEPSDVPSTPSSPAGTPSATPGEPPSGTPSSSAEPETTAVSLDDLDVRASFDRSAYATGEDMDITVTVTNNGAEEIRASTVIRDESDAVSVTSANTLDSLTIGAGETVVRKLTGVMARARFATGTLYLLFTSGSDQRQFAFPVAVTPRFGHVTGTVYRDANGNGVFDRGEGLAGATLTWDSDLDDDSPPTVTTDGAGAFALDVPTGAYHVRGEAPGVEIGSRAVDVPESGIDGLLFRATAPLRDLTATAAFTKDTYEPDDVPTLRITLTNTGDLALTGIVARCADYPASLKGTGAGWGNLAGAGMTVSPHSTVSIDVTEPMPDGVAGHGFVVADCTLSYAGVSSDLNPRFQVSAPVPGTSADVTGTVSSSVDTDLTGFRVVVTARGGGCPIVAEATTGRDGSFSLGQLPVGRYLVILVPPTDDWRVATHNFADLDVVAGQENRIGFEVSPGARNRDFKVPPNCTAAPQGSVLPPLAYTGASLVLPGVAGLVALILGAGTLLLVRRRGDG
ncbi:carboxypeptidase-like regulatory domain-containing protein [Actinophytocola oryzae]|uniref:Carboxypeptidase family protein n=1 Tax=Actinophytocola oryzae TaxID=502181 RepID=A0A4R7V973_9PSEU|nr:carboxypeptidase-like regulatory domain-containing protein [Actinophytocola oryzae]TDV45468.1 carboxypeptidase family protein [Actinophytocola oryzae]